MMKAGKRPDLNSGQLEANRVGDDWKLLSSVDQMKLAEQLDRYAQLLEGGDDSAADSFLKANSGLLRSMRAHVEDLKVLCRLNPESTKPTGSEIEDQDCAPEFADIPSGRRTLGDYQIQREIGRGGMGIVYEATQLSLRRNVALKTLPFAAVLDQQQVVRFRNEAQAAASLHHPHIVPVFAVGCERGVHYYSMQLINGQTLEQTLSELISKCGLEQRSKRLLEMRLHNALQSVANTTTLSIELPPDSIEAESLVDRSDRSSAASTIATARASAPTIDSVRDRTSIRRLVEIFIKTADALDYAHAQGVIHRDIKPSNLLIDEYGKVWVADFGLARCRSLGNLTAEGKVMGTVRYMSPEQIAGKPQEVDHRTDIYSLGITLYELLTLQPAYIGTSRDRLMRSVEIDDPIAPRRLNPSIAVDLETIVLKAICKSKHDRYATAAEMRDDLQRFLDGHAPLAKRPTVIDLAFKWAMRRRGTVLASLLTLMAIVAGLTISNAIVAKHSAAKDQANEQARFHLSQAHAAVDRFGGIIADRLDENDGRDLLRQEVLQEAERYYTDFIRYAETDSQMDRELAKIHFQLGAVHSRLGDFTQAEASYKQSIAIFVNLAKAQPLDLESASDQASCLHNLAALYRDLGRYAEAKSIYREALAKYEAALTVSDPSDDLISRWAATQSSFGVLLIECGASQEAEDRLETVVSKLERVLSLNPGNTLARQQLAECRNTLVATILDHDFARSQRLLNQTIEELQALEAMTNQVRSGSPLSLPCQIAVARNNLATLLGKHDRSDDAITNVLKAIEALGTELERRPVDRNVREQLAIAQNNLGQLRYSTKSVNAAVKAFDLSESNFRQLLSEGSAQPRVLSRLAGVLHNQSAAHVVQGEYELAVQPLTEAMDYQATAVKKAPFNQGYRQYLEMHRELLDHVLHQFNKLSSVGDRNGVHE